MTLLRALDGILLVDKPEGPTSAEVVTKLKHHLHPEKIGHAGTLDPLATGLLPVCFGEGTKLATHLSGSRKRYRATAVLGAATDTQDRLGTVLRRGEVPADSARVVETLRGFLGRYAQRPPMYSAKKREGRPLYELARAGVEVAREAVEVEIFALDAITWAGDTVRFEVEASKGFYVRTLCHDLGERLGCGAHLGALRRLRHGALRLEDAVPLDALLAREAETLAHELWPLADARLGIQSITVPEEWVARVRNGHAVPFAAFADGAAEELRLALDPQGVPLALWRADATVGEWRVERGLRLAADR